MLFGCIYIIYLIQTSSWTGLGKCREEDGKIKGTALAWKTVELGSGHGPGMGDLGLTSEAAGNPLGELGQTGVSHFPPLGCTFPLERQVRQQPGSFVKALAALGLRFPCFTRSSGGTLRAGGENGLGVRQQKEIVDLAPPCRQGWGWLFRNVFFSSLCRYLQALGEGRGSWRPVLLVGESSCGTG